MEEVPLGNKVPRKKWRPWKRTNCYLVLMVWFTGKRKTFERHLETSSWLLFSGSGTAVLTSAQWGHPITVQYCHHHHLHHQFLLLLLPLLLSLLKYNYMHLQLPGVLLVVLYCHGEPCLSLRMCMKTCTGEPVLNLMCWKQQGNTAYMYKQHDFVLLPSLYCNYEYQCMSVHL